MLREGLLSAFLHAARLLSCMDCPNSWFPPLPNGSRKARAHRIEHLARKVRSTITSQKKRLKQIPKQSWSCHSAGTHLAYYRQALSKLRQARIACLSLPSPCEVLAISLRSTCHLLAKYLPSPCEIPVSYFCSRKKVQYATWAAYTSDRPPLHLPYTSLSHCGGRTRARPCRFAFSAKNCDLGACEEDCRRKKPGETRL